MATLTVYSSVSDGELRKGGNTYTEAHDAASGTIGGTTTYMRLGQHYYNNFYNVYRGGLFFDTSALPDAAIITAAILTLFHINPQGAPDASFNITIVSGADLDDPMVATDYGDLLNKVTALASLLDASGLSNNTPYDFTLNEAGIATISKTGVTKFGVRSSRDIGNIAPGTDPNPFVESNYFSTREEEDSARHPKLVITYHLGLYPSDAVARVSSIRHIFQPSLFRMQLGVGDLGLDVDVADTTALLVEKWEEEMKRTIDDIRSYGIIPTPGQARAKRPPPIGLGPLGQAARDEQIFKVPDKPPEPIELGPLGKAAREEQVFIAPKPSPRPVGLGPLGRAAREEQIFVAPKRPVPEREPTVPTRPSISQRGREFVFPGFTRPAKPVATAKVTEERPVTDVQPGALDRMLRMFRLRKARPVSIEEEKAKFARLRTTPKPRRVGITKAIRDLMRFR